MLVHQAGGRNMSPEEIANKMLDLVPHAEKTRKAVFCERTHPTGSHELCH